MKFVGNMELNPFPFGGGSTGRLECNHGQGPGEPRLVESAAEGFGG